MIKNKTMEELFKLIGEAEKTCKWRGHNLVKWEYPTPTKAVNYCSKCGHYVAVNLKPPPNGIDIGGECVALNCK